MNFDCIEPLTDEQRATVEANLRLVPHVVHRIYGIRPGHEADDMIASGYFGLMRAAQKFEPERGFTFSTYACIWIRQAIQKGKADFEGVDYRAWKAGRRESWRPALSLDNGPRTLNPEYSDGQMDGYQVLPAEVDVEAEVEASLGEIRQAAYAGCLDDVDRYVVDGLAEGRTLAAMADELGVTREAARQRRVRIARRVGGSPVVAYG